MGGGGPDAATMPATTVAQAPVVTTGDGGITAASAAQNMGGGVSNIVPPTTAPFVETSPNVLAATNVPGTPIVPTRGGAQVIVDPRTGDTYAPGDYSDVAGTLEDPREKIDDYQDPNFIQRLQNTWNTSGLKGVVSEFGQNAANMLSGLKDKGMDVGRMATGALMSALAPGAGLLMKMVPEETQIDKFNREYALGGDLYQNVVSQVDDPKFEGRIQGYADDLIAGTGEGKDPFGKNTVSLMGDYPAMATEIYNELTEKAKTKELSQFDKDRLEYYGHVSGLTGKTNIPGTPLMTDASPLRTTPGGDDIIDFPPPKKPEVIGPHGTLASDKWDTFPPDYIGPDVTDEELYGVTTPKSTVAGPFDYLQPDYELEQTATDYAKDYLGKDIAPTTIDDVTIKGRRDTGDITDYLGQESTLEEALGTDSAAEKAMQEQIAAAEAQEAARVREINAENIREEAAQRQREEAANRAAAEQAAAASRAAAAERAAAEARARSRGDGGGGGGGADYSNVSTAGQAGPPSQRGGGNGSPSSCFLKGTPVTMADGSTKAVEQVDLGDNVAKGGKVFATGKFLVDNLHDYKGIKVSGSHTVKEDNKWIRVKDSKHGKPLGDDEHIVYVFGAENRRILINDILFTDYFEVNEQEKLIENEEDYFKNWKLYIKKDDINKINVLNAN